MGIVEHRKSLRLELQHLIDGRIKTGKALPGRTIDQVEIHGIKAVIAEQLHGCDIHRLGLPAVDRVLHLGITVLHPKRRTADPHPSKGSDLLGAQAARVQLNGFLGIRREAEVTIDHRPESVNLCGSKNLASPTEVQLHLTTRRNTRPKQLQLTLQKIEVVIPRPRSRVVIWWQPQNQQSVSQNGKWKYNDKGASPARTDCSSGVGSRYSRK